MQFGQGLEPTLNVGTKRHRTIFFCICMVFFFVTVELHGCRFEAVDLVCIVASRHRAPGCTGTDQHHCCGANEPYPSTYRVVYKSVLFSIVNHCAHHLMTFLEQKETRKVSCHGIQWESYSQFGGYQPSPPPCPNLAPPPAPLLRLSRPPGSAEGSSIDLLSRIRVGKTSFCPNCAHSKCSEQNRQFENDVKSERPFFFNPPPQPLNWAPSSSLHPLSWPHSPETLLPPNPPPPAPAAPSPSPASIDTPASRRSPRGSSQAYHLKLWWGSRACSSRPAPRPQTRSR